MKICKIQKCVYILSCLANLIQSQSYVSPKERNFGNEAKFKLKTVLLTLIVNIPERTFSYRNLRHLMRERMYAS